METCWVLWRETEKANCWGSSMAKYWEKPMMICWVQSRETPMEMHWGDQMVTKKGIGWGAEMVMH